MKNIFKFNNNAFSANGFHGDKSPLNDRVENGRSMVEMLGVLAIIGVLSVGGIAGYRMAMDQHRVNQVYNAITMAVVDYIATPYGTQNKTVNYGNGVSATFNRIKKQSYDCPDAEIRITVPWKSDYISKKNLTEIANYMNEISYEEGLSDYENDNLYSKNIEGWTVGWYTSNQLMGSIYYDGEYDLTEFPEGGITVTGGILNIEISNCA